MPQMIRLDNVSKIYTTGAQPVQALRNVSLQIEHGEFVAVTGESGSGKSTLLHLLGGLDRPTAGSVFVDEVPIHDATEEALTAFRRVKLGFIFQFFNLMPAMTLVENVALPLLLQGSPRSSAMTAAQAELSDIGLGDKAERFPHQVSGGEMQRTAIARALVHKPALLLADEPTGNLDSRNVVGVLDLFDQISGRKDSPTILLVTHSREAASRARRQLVVADGLVTGG